MVHPAENTAVAESDNKEGKGSLLFIRLFNNVFVSITEDWGIYSFCQTIWSASNFVLL